MAVEYSSIGMPMAGNLRPESSNWKSNGFLGVWSQSYGVDGSFEIRRDLTHQLRTVGSWNPIVYKVLAPSQVVVWDFWTINSTLGPCFDVSLDGREVTSRSFCESGWSSHKWSLTRDHWKSRVCHTRSLTAKAPESHGGWKTTGMSMVLSKWIISPLYK